MNNETYDIIIIGGGPAGLSAAIYTARMGKKTLLLEGGMYGGRTAKAPNVWNYPGFPDGIKGTDLVDLMVKQAEKYQATLKFSNEVIDIQLTGKQKKIVTREGTYQGDVLILATGTHSKKLRIPGETDFLGLGVSYCPVCDGPLYRGLRVAVIGSGSEAFEDAFFMADFAQEVFLITHTTDITAEQKFIEEAEKKSNITLVSGQLLKIIGDQLVTGLQYRGFEDESENKLEIDGVFVSLGGVPLTTLVKKAGVKVDKRGCIMVDRRQATNIDGVYAAGDCTCGGMQVITAAGEGAMAGIQAYRFTKKQ